MSMKSYKAGNYSIGDTETRVSRKASLRRSYVTGNLYRRRE
jgi:hypothetical protein